jgi:hypothetical protein
MPSAYGGRDEKALQSRPRPLLDAGPVISPAHAQRAGQLFSEELGCCHGLRP